MNFKHSALFAAILLGAIAKAESPLTVAVTSSAKASVFNVYYKNAEAGRVQVTILNNRNEVVFTEILNNMSSFKRPYNFSEVGEGKYTIVVEDKSGKHIETVNYSTNKVTSFIKVSRLNHAPNKYLLNVYPLGGTEEVTVRIYNDTKGLLHEEKLTVTGNYGIVFNLNQVQAAQASAVTFQVETTSGKVETAVF